MYVVTILYLALVIIGVFGFIVYLFKRGEIYDLGWTICVIAIYTVSLLDSRIAPFILPVIFLWGLKLLVVVMARLVYFEHDFRYEQVENHFNAGLFQFISGIIFGLPSIFERFYPGVNPVLFWLGFGLAVISLVLNTVSDIQLLSHRLKKTGSFLKTGMWRICRYPNYFFEILFWTGITISFFNSRYELLSLFTPIYVWFILRYFSGISPQEKRRLEKYGDEYKKYSQEVPLLCPFWRKF